MEHLTLVAEGSMLLGDPLTLHKVTAPRSGDVSSLIFIKQTQRSGNEETEEYVSNEGKDKI